MKAFIVLISLFAVCSALNGKSTRYWDCCKPSCGWNDKGPFVNKKPVTTCAADGVTPVGDNVQSACNGGSSYTCNNNQPWAVNSNLAYGFVAGRITGQSEWDWCCACYELTFTSGPVNGKKMVVQVTNTGGDLGENHFDIQIPGGGVGLFNGCQSQWGAPGDGWGARYGGVSSRDQCNQLPSQLRPGCQWRFDWFLNADNPTFSFVQVACPAAITAKSGCVRS
ncbi:hypothetical protein HA402_013513 [Bradysia odoriphaga]|nr:hypothetical protein HA402_013506 [Bradysia odoriphaga]KAG4075118.1 hypothetical protein HA402_013513 [Bradysia odoriphaga]